MPRESKLGKISDVHYGMCGYQEMMMGLRVTISGDGWGVGADKPGAWTTEITGSTQWTHQDRIKNLGENAWYICGLLKEAKVDSVDKLKGVPVECEFEGNTLRSWRVLKEVL